MKVISGLVCERYFCFCCCCFAVLFCFVNFSWFFKSCINHHFHWETFYDPLVLASQSPVTWCVEISLFQQLAHLIMRIYLHILLLSLDCDQISSQYVIIFLLHSAWYIIATLTIKLVHASRDYWRIGQSRWKKWQEQRCRVWEMKQLSILNTLSFTILLLQYH